MVQGQLVYTSARLDTLYAKIQTDPRNTRHSLLIREPIDHRSFVDWTMGYTHVSVGEIQDASGVNDFFRDAEAFAELNSAKVTKVLDLFRAGMFRQRIE
jgi:hypothetical protein